MGVISEELKLASLTSASVESDVVALNSSVCVSMYPRNNTI